MPAILLATLASCAAREPSAVESEMRSLRAEIRALRADRESDRQRLELLEAHVSALSRREPDAPGARHARQASQAPPADLAVVKLEPDDGGADGGSIFIVDRGDGRGGATGGPDAAPPLATDVDLREPASLDAAPAPAVDYENGMAALAEGKPGQAAELLERFVKRSPRHTAADNALLALGEAYAREGQPGRALQTWQRVVKEYPAGDAVARALLRYGSTCRELGRKAAARAALQRVIQDFPGSESAAEARSELAGL